VRKDSRKSREPKWKSAPIVRGKLNCKAKGELGEMVFLHKASSLGFGVAKPFGDNERYDFILDSGKRLWRIQVKSIYRSRHRGYHTSIRRGRGAYEPYHPTEVDFMVAYVAPPDIWYVIPVNSLAGSASLSFYPSGCRSGGYFEAYREAWHLMAPPIHIDTRAARP